MKIRSIVREIVLIPTHLYKLIISPYFPSSCIYNPTCSTYMIKSVRQHGIFKGPILGLARIFRCHGSCFIGGSDPVPPRFSFEEVKKPYKIFRKVKKKDK